MVEHTRTKRAVRLVNPTLSLEARVSVEVDDTREALVGRYDMAMSEQLVIIYVERI